MTLRFPAEAVIFLMLGLLFAAAGWYGRRQQQARRQRGRRTEATIVALTPGRRLLRPTVRFVTAEQQAVEAETESGVVPDRYALGQPVAVVYDPAEPSNVDLAGVPPAGTGWLLALGLVLAAVGTLQVLGLLPVFEDLQHQAPIRQAQP